MKRKSVWYGSFGVFWLATNRAWATIYSPSKNVRTGSILGIHRTREEAMRMAGAHSDWMPEGSRHKRKTRTSRRR